MMADRFGRRPGLWLGLVAVLVGTVAAFGPGNGPLLGSVPAPGELVAVAEPLRQTEAEALAAAKAEGQAIEIGAFRSERRDVWANPDGTLTEYNHQQPVRTVKNHRWVTPDATLERASDGSLRPKAATFGLRISGGGKGPLLTAERAGRSMSLTWPGGPLPVPVVNGESVTFADVAPGLDLVVNVGIESFSHLLVVKTPEAAHRAEVLDLALGLSTRGMDVAATGDGTLTAVDSASRGRIFEAPAPLMWDSGDAQAEGRIAQMWGEPVRPASAAMPRTAKRATVGVRVADGSLRLTPDRKLLTDPSLKYPLFIDPVWQSTTTTFWAMVDSGYADTEYPKFDGAFQTSNNERAGYCPRVSGDVYGCNDSLVKRLFYRLPASYAGKTILSAQFQISLTNGWNTTPHNISLYRMTTGISSSTNWSNQPNGSGWSGAVLQQTRSLGAEQACTSTTRNSIFDATESVRWAATNSKTEITFGIKNANESDYTHHKRFCENALLKVNWNRAPAQPAVSDLQLAPGGACVFGAARPYSDTRPVLKATLRDPDHLAASGDAEDLKAEFRVQWTPTGGTLQTATFQTGNQASGTPWGWSFNTVNLTFPQNVVVSWDVRAFDGTVWGPWSSDGAANPCEFVYDTTVPTPPLVSSPEFLRSDLVDCSQYDDPAWRDGVGVATVFTFDSAATDVIEYRYGINTNPSASNVLRPSSDGGPVNLPWLANMEGPNFITVQAYDRASKSSAIATCTFRVSAGQPAVAEWGLADVGGDGEPVSDGRGNAPATAHGSVVFGVPGPGGPADRAIQLPGTEDSYLDTETAGLVDTGKSFSVSAWVRLTDTSRSQVIVSQDGSGEPGFRLGFNEATNKWSFAVPVTDVESLGEWKVEAGTPTSLWTHLLAVYDAQDRELRLYVDNNAVVTSVRRSAWRSRGAVQIGRVLSKAGYTGYFKGELADVALFNRVLVPAEVGQQIQAVPARRGYWPLNTATGTTSENLVSGGQVLTLSGATVVAADPLGDPPVIPMMGLGELYLDGVDDYASTASSVVATDGSFTVTARVRLASPDSGPAMAVLSQKGASQDSGFIVRRNDANRWELALPQADEPGGEVDTAFDDQAPPLGEQQGQLLALVYNGFTNDAVLYVDGQLAASAKVNHALAWNATGGFQVGRAFIDGVFSEYLAGSIDDVRVYAGALDQTTVQQLNQLIELPDL